MSKNKILPYRTDLHEKARRLRRESTASEIEFWLQVKKKKLLGFEFHRQVPMLNFIVDFYCHELMLAIEIDGCSHDNDDTRRYDAYWQSELEKRGVIFLRFTNARIENELEVVLEEIRVFIRGRASTSPPGPLQRGTKVVAWIDV